MVKIAPVVEAGLLDKGLVLGLLLDDRPVEQLEETAPPQWREIDGEDRRVVGRQPRQNLSGSPDRASADSATPDRAQRHGQARRR